MESFIQKNFKLEIQLTDTKTIFCEYKQGSMRDVLEFSDAITTKKEYAEIIMWFLNKHGAYRKYFLQSFTKSVKVKKKDLKYLRAESAEKLMNYIMKTYAKGYFKEIKPRTDEEKKQFEEKTKKIPDGVFLAFIIEHTNETFESLMAMPYEAILSINDGILWNLRSKTKKGQQENERIARMEAMKDGESIEEALARAKEIERQLKLNKS